MPTPSPFLPHPSSPLPSPSTCVVIPHDDHANNPRSSSSSSSSSSYSSLVKPRSHLLRRRGYRRVCWCCLGWCLVFVVLVVVMVLVFLFCVLKQPTLVFQGIQHAQHRPHWFEVNETHLAMHLDVLYDVTNTNRFTIDVYALDVKVYPDNTYTDHVAVGQLRDLALLPGKQLVTLPLTLAVPLSLSPTSSSSSSFAATVVKACVLPTSSVSSSDSARKITMYYEVQVGVTWIKFTGYMLKVRGQHAVACPAVHLDQWLQQHPVPAKVLQALQQHVPELLQALPTVTANSEVLQSVKDLSGQVNPAQIKDLLNNKEVQNIINGFARRV